MHTSVGFRMLVVVGAICLLLGGCATPPPSQTSPEEQSTSGQLTKKSLDEYSWDELSQISSMISGAPNEEGARDIAKVYGLVEDDGALTTQTKQIVLDGKRALDVRIAGLLHDDRADGKGKAGITFMTVGAMDILAMNDEATIEGGWEASALRGRLANEQKARFDPDLQQAIVPVTKMTNNVGFIDSVDSISPTSDELWLFSVHEVCGDVTWDIDEFRAQRGSEDVDGMLNAEGFQYECFAQAGVHAESDPNGYLSLANTTGKSPWWYRSPYPFEFTQYGETGNTGFFYQVMDSGFPQSLGSPEVPASVVVGFCV